MKFFKASLDSFTKVITTFVIIIAIVVPAIALFATYHQSNVPAYTEAIILLLPIILITVFIYCYLTRPLGYIVDGNEIIIKMQATRRAISKLDIKSITAIPFSDLRFKAVRTFGNGGFFGYTGWYYNTNYGSMRYYATQLKNYVLIETVNNKKIIITPDDLDGFLKETTNLK